MVQVYQDLEQKVVGPLLIRRHMVLMRIKSGIAINRGPVVGVIIFMPL